MSKTLLRHTLIETIFFTFLLKPYLYTFSLYENPSFIIFSAETEYISRRSWYRNINFLRERIRRIFFIALVQQPVSQMKMTFQEIRIIATGRHITNQLLDVKTIWRRSLYIAAHIWKIYDFKFEVVPFIINFSTELTTVVKLNIYSHFSQQLFMAEI